MAMDACQKLTKIVKDGRSLDKYPTTTPITVLLSIVLEFLFLNLAKEVHFY